MTLSGFRQETRDWLEAMCPPEMRSPIEDPSDVCWGGRGWEFQSDAQRLWLERMASRGWTAPTWPAEYGGGGLGQDEAEILSEELSRISARPALASGSVGLTMLGPALLKFGSEELKRKHLPAIVRGEIRWCQGYSEPNAGSDLASLQARAEDRGDHFLVNGQKVWTSYANKSDWIFALLRTDPAAPKHKGISFILMDMATPGISVRPIRLISGESSFCETFFDDVVVAKGSIVGRENGGWEIAKYLLTHERETLSETLGAFAPDLVDTAKERIGVNAAGQLAGAGLRSAVVQAEIDARALKLTIARIKDQAAHTGQPIGPMSAVLKYYGTELNKRRLDLFMDLLGSEGLEWSENTNGNSSPPQAWLRSKANTIEGGTSEIMLGIISKLVLQLPES